METENAQGFIERRVIDLIALDEDIPDTGGPKFQCNKLTWPVPVINSKIRQLMDVNFPYIKIKGSKFSEDRYIPLPPTDLYTGRELEDTYNESYYWSHYIWDVGDEDWSNMRVSFIYEYNTDPQIHTDYDLEWPNNFYIRPNNYPSLFSNSQKGTNMLSLLCMHIWHFTYDIVFPVKVAIVDEETIDNDEYLFNFAFKGSIDHNEPNRDVFSISSYETENLVQDEEFCNSNFTLQNNIVITAIENTTTGHEINNVNLTLVCGRFTCPLGQTEAHYDGAGGLRYWEGITPYCTLGVLKAQKQGYADAERFIQTDDERMYTIYMTPVKDFRNFTVMKHQYMGEMLPAAPAQQLAEDESALIILKHNDFEKTLTYSKNKSIAEGQDILTILAEDDYEYSVEIYLMNNNAVIGGFKGTWETDKYDIKAAEEVIFHVLYKEFADETEKALFFAGLQSYSDKVKDPELK